MRHTAKKLPTLTDEQLSRFWGYVVKTNYCWQWNGPKRISENQRHVYGTFWAGQHIAPHRFTLSLSVGERPDLDVDHKCKNTLCVNPEHLEWVTYNENQFRRRNPNCKYGHPMVNSSCGECNTIRVRLWREKHRDRVNEISRASYARIGRKDRRKA